MQRHKEKRSDPNKKIIGFETENNITSLKQKIIQKDFLRPAKETSLLSSPGRNKSNSKASESDGSEWMTPARNQSGTLQLGFQQPSNKELTIPKQRKTENLSSALGAIEEEAPTP